MNDAIDQFLALPVWRETPIERLIPLAEAATIRRCEPGEILFKQFHPADQFLLLIDGSVSHETSEDDIGGAWSMGHIDWAWGAVGWSGFMPPNRNCTTARALSPLSFLCWQHEDLARLFYADPLLAIDFLRLVLDSMQRQFGWLRTERLAKCSRRNGLVPKAGNRRQPDSHRFAPGLLTTLRRSAFFELFDDAQLALLARDAHPVRFGTNREVVRQGDRLGGLWVLASGKAVSCFMSAGADGERLERFRSIQAEGSIVAGLPCIDGSYTAEATVVTESVCCIYEIPVASIAACIRRDPEFGRSLMQRHLTRLAQLIAAARLPRPVAGDEDDIAAVKSMLAHNQARVPVNSDLYKLPHLLSHRLTTGNAFACINTVAETGRYEERAIARSCRDILNGRYREHHFYRDVLDAYRDVVDAPPDTPARELRQLCDKRLGEAFGHLDTEIHNIGRLPARPGNIVIMNHLACPAEYQLPNNYHFSFDTAFVSVLLSARYGQAPIRVVRQSPGSEYGHNLFYSRLGHITVPTIESGIAGTDDNELERLRRTAGELLFQHGSEALAAGNDMLICPEGQSQPAADSPGRFFSGAFRLAQRAATEPMIVPIAIAGFDRRYKDSRLVAIVQEPFLLSTAMEEAGTANLREFLDYYQRRFRLAVNEAMELSGGRPQATPVAKILTAAR